MTHQDNFLFNLAKVYQQGANNRATDLTHFCKQTGADFEEIEAYAAKLRAEGSIRQMIMPHVYVMTDAGYAKYSPRLAAVERLEGL